MKAINLLFVLSLLATGCGGDSDRAMPASGVVPADGGADNRNDGDTSEDATVDASVDPFDDLVACGDADTTIDSFELSDIEGCERVRSDMRLARYLEKDVNVLRSLRRADGDLVIATGDSLVSVEGLSSLRSVGDMFALNNLPLSDLKGLENLREVGGDLTLAYINVTSLAPLANLETVGSLQIAGLSELRTLSELKSLKRIDGQLRIESAGIDEADLSEFIQRVQVKGDILFNSKPWPR